MTHVSIVRSTTEENQLGSPLSVPLDSNEKFVTHERTQATGKVMDLFRKANIFNAID